MKTSESGTRAAPGSRAWRERSGLATGCWNFEEFFYRGRGSEKREGTGKVGSSFESRSGCALASKAAVRERDREHSVLSTGGEKQQGGRSDREGVRREREARGRDGANGRGAERSDGRRRRDISRRACPSQRPHPALPCLQSRRAVIFVAVTRCSDASKTHLVPAQALFFFLPFSRRAAGRQRADRTAGCTTARRYS